MVIKKDILNFLHGLRESGAINMFGAAPYLVERFGLEKSEARKITMAYVTGDFLETAERQE